MKRTDSVPIDPRGAAELKSGLAALAASYTPEWEFSANKPDAGSVIALIFAAQLEDTIGRLNGVMERYHTEFVNLLKLSPLPAAPASGVAVFEPLTGAGFGADVPSGTKLLGESAGEAAEAVVFETARELHVTGSRLCDVLMVSSAFGKIIPLYGGWRRAELIPAEEGEEPAESALEPFIPFDYSGEGVERSAVLLYHKTVLDTAAGVRLAVYAEEKATGRGLGGLLADPLRFRWSYYGGDGFVPFDEVEAEGGAVLLRKTGENGRLRLGGEDYALICAEALVPIENSIEVGRVELSSSCEETAPECVLHGGEQLEGAELLPFGQSASVFDECYIGHNRVFCRCGAEITLSFLLSYQKKLVAPSFQQEQENLRVIKRKPRTAQQQPAEACVQRTALEYFNGLGWRALGCGDDWSGIFSGRVEGEIKITFRCPDDWEQTVIGGLELRALRLRVLQAENCYLQPCVHTMPVLARVRLSYRYENGGEPPQRLQRICGVVREDLTAALTAGGSAALFSPLPHPQGALLLGFDRPFLGAPISIFFDIEAASGESGAVLFQYSTASGFLPLEVIDHTRGLCSAGTVVFAPPGNFAAVSVEGKTRFWLRIVSEHTAPRRAVVRGIHPNAAEIINLETRREESFYIDNSVPDMVFPLGESGLYSAEVFVNECGSFTQEAMRRMLDESPEDFRGEYDSMGELNGFFVRWGEVDSFDDSTPADRHYVLNRADGTLRFGDGAAVMIPAARAGTAFTVRTKRCDGARGNLPAGAVNAPLGRLLYIGGVYSPVATCGGSDMEGLENALLRGANQISSHGRLVSEPDFMREVKAFSPAVDKVKCAMLRGEGGGRVIGIAVLTRDFERGSYAFSNLKARLKAHLLQKCEAAVTEKSLRIFEPDMIEISVEVWAETASPNRVFEVKAALLEGITGFINPLSVGGRGGWAIGELPAEEQIAAMLRSVKVPADICRFAVTTRFMGRDGGLDAHAGNPFAIGINGSHRIHIGALGS